MNVVILTGRVGGDVETRVISQDFTSSKFSLATSSNRKNKEGEWEEETQWHNIEAGRDLSYLGKGDLVNIQGEIKYDSWEKDGEKKYMTKIRAIRIERLLKSGSDAKPKEDPKVPGVVDGLPF